MRETAKRAVVKLAIYIDMTFLSSFPCNEIDVQTLGLVAFRLYVALRSEYNIPLYVLDPFLIL